MLERVSYEKECSKILDKNMLKSFWEDFKLDCFKGSKKIRRIPEVIGHKMGQWAVSWEATPETPEMEEEAETFQVEEEGNHIH